MLLPPPSYGFCTHLSSPHLLLCRVARVLAQGADILFACSMHAEVQPIVLGCLLFKGDNLLEAWLAKLFLIFVVLQAPVQQQGQTTLYKLHDRCALERTG